MKSTNQPSFYFSPLSVKSDKQEPTANPSNQSPYLRAVLSDKRTTDSAKVFSLGNSSMAAALRYISGNK